MPLDVIATASRTMIAKKRAKPAKVPQPTFAQAGILVAFSVNHKPLKRRCFNGLYVFHDAVK